MRTIMRKVKKMILITVIICVKDFFTSMTLKSLKLKHKRLQITFVTLRRVKYYPSLER
jgi:hypothetical protein